MSSSSCSVGFCPKLRMTEPSSFVVMVPSPSRSKSEKASLNSKRDGSAHNNYNIGHTTETSTPSRCCETVIAIFGFLTWPWKPENAIFWPQNCDLTFSFAVKPWFEYLCPRESSKEMTMKLWFGGPLDCRYTHTLILYTIRRNLKKLLIQTHHCTSLSQFQSRSH